MSWRVLVHVRGPWAGAGPSTLGGGTTTVNGFFSGSPVAPERAAKCFPRRAYMTALRLLRLVDLFELFCHFRFPPFLFCTLSPASSRNGLTAEKRAIVFLLYRRATASSMNFSALAPAGRSALEGPPDGGRLCQCKAPGACKAGAKRGPLRRKTRRPPCGPAGPFSRSLRPSRPNGQAAAPAVCFLHRRRAAASPHKTPARRRGKIPCGGGRPTPLRESALSDAFPLRGGYLCGRPAGPVRPGPRGRCNAFFRR